MKLKPIAVITVLLVVASLFSSRLACLQYKTPHLYRLRVKMAV
jgi:hypothetical protein